MAAVVDGETPLAAYRLVIYGEVRYSEVRANSQTQSPYWTRFCYLFTTEQPSQIGGDLILCGPREYNEVT